MAEFLLSVAQGIGSLVAPLFPGEPVKFGPRPAWEVTISLICSTTLCYAVGYRLTRSNQLVRLVSRTPYLRNELRDEAWIDDLKSIVTGGTGAHRKRSAAELLFIAVHNGTVTLMAAAAWLIGSPSLALHAFTMEVGYEIFDTFNLGPASLEPETLIHHIVAPICILCSTQTDVDFRVLCHLCICIDFSGAVLGYCKFLLRFAHVSSAQVYCRLGWVHGLMRVALPLVDSAIIVRNSVVARGGLFRWSEPQTLESTDRMHPMWAQTDWTQLYFWAMAVLNAFNTYFWCVIRARAKLPQHVLSAFEGCTGPTGSC